MGISFEHERTVPSQEVVNSWMSAFDLSRDSHISEEEFMHGMTKWLKSIGRNKSDTRPHHALWNEEEQVC